MKTKSFCVLPFNSLATTPGGTLRICCNSDTNLNVIRKADGTRYKVYKDDLVEAWNSEDYKTIRRQMLNGDKPKMCLRCWKEEDAGLESARHRFNDKWYADTKNYSVDQEFKIEYLDLRLGNLCNLKCRMCNPYSSNQWIKEWELLGNSWQSEEELAWLSKLEWPTYYKLWESLLSAVDSIEEIYLTGGEPTIIKEQYKLLNYLIEEGKARNIKLKYNTNLTNIPEELVELWKHFYFVQLNCSIDGVGELNRYIRYPSNWDAIIENFLYFRTWPNIYIEIHCTVQLYNILTLDQFVEYFIGYDHLLYFNILDRPSYLNIQILPTELKKLVENRLSKYYHVSKVEGVVNYMNAVDRSAELKTFFKNMTIIDKARNQNFLELQTEFKKWI